MASAKVSAAMQVLLSSDLSSLSNEDVKSLVEHARKDLKSRGVKSRTTSSRESYEERADAPFDPNKCHARQHVLAKHPGSKTDLFKSSRNLHIGLLNIQCNCKPTDGGNLCKNHSKTNAFSDATRCYKTGELYLGLYNQDKPVNPQRQAPPREGKHEGYTRNYIWLEDVTDEHDQFKNDPPGESSPSTKTKKKSQSKKDSGEKYEDFNWKIAVNSGDIKKFKKSRLQLYLIHHGIDTRGEENSDGKRPLHNAKKLIEIICQHINPPDEAPQDDEEPQDDSQDEQSQQDETPDQQDDDDRETVNNSDDDEDMDQEDQVDTIKIDGVTYDVEDGYVYDAEDGTKMGKIDPEKKKGIDWGFEVSDAKKKQRLKLHGDNIAQLMADEN